MMEHMTKSHKIRRLIKSYPVPVIALIGLIVAGIFHWFYSIEVGRWALFTTLIIAGTPVMWEIIRGMLKKHFASDIVAMLAIVASILLNDAFPGVVIVLMQSGGKALEDYAFRKASSSIDNL